MKGNYKAQADHTLSCTGSSFGSSISGVRELLEMVAVVVVVVVVLLGWSAAGLSSAATVIKCIIDKAEVTVINSAVCVYSGLTTKL